MFVPQKIRELSPIPDEDLHWLAGLLEGEGSFLAGPPSAPRSPAVQVAMADRDIVERAGAPLGVAVMVVPSRREGWRTAYSVRVRGAPAVLWMERLRPFMGQRRQGQIDRAIRAVRHERLVHLRLAAWAHTRPLGTAGLAVFVLVRHAAGFAALFLGWAAWGDDAQDSHCLQAQGEALAAVG
jgi:hypothetical protein